MGNSKFPSLSAPSAEYNGLIFAETFGDLAYTMYSHAVSLRDLGCTQSPMNAWITLNGVETLPLRMERHCSNGLAVAEFLEKHQNVEWVSHAGLKSSPYYKLGKKYFPKGTGSLFAASAGPEVVRLSVGIECAEDLIADLDQALNKL